MAENEPQHHVSDYTPAQRVGQVLATMLLIAILSWSAGRMLWYVAAQKKLLFPVRALLLATAVLMLLGAAGMAVSPIKRKLSTGRFFLTRPEIQAKQAEIRARMGAGKPFWPQARPWIISWAILAVLAGLGISTLVLTFRTCDCGWKVSGMLLALGAAFFFLPAFVTVKALLRKRKTGSFLPSQEELDNARSTCAQPKSLRQRIVSAGMFWLIALLWTFSAFRHHGSYQQILGSKWVLPGLWWPIALIWTWQIFYPPVSQCAIDPETPLSIKPPDSNR